jgi:hypothetical protein
MAGAFGTLQPYIGEQQAQARAGDVVFLRPGEKRVTTNPTQEPLSIIGFVYRATLLNTVEFVTALDAPLCLHSGVDTTRLDQLLSDVVEASRNRAPGAIFVAAGSAQLALAEAFSALMRHELDVEQKNTADTAFA